MEAQLQQQNNLGVSEEAVAVGCIQQPPVSVMELAAPCLEAQYALRPLVFIPPHASGLASGETSARNDAIVNSNSPRLMPKSLVQGPSQQSAFYVGCGGENEQLSHFQYEDLAGIMGERSGSASDMSVISEKICSGYGSSGEHCGGRVKFMCSFGGKILPRPGDGKLRYAGGDTRIVSIYRHSKYNDLMCKMQQLYGQPVLLKYQLPNEDLDALISVSCDEDVDNMMEEYDRLQSSDGSSKLRIFLFPPSEYDVGLVTDVSDTRSTEKVYVDAVNGMSETQTVRPVVVMPTYSSNNVMGLESSDTWGSQQVPIGISHGTSIVPPTSFVIAPAIGQPIPVGMIQTNNMQHFPREFSSSPVNPSSPTVGSNIRQPVIPDISQNLCPDQIVKGLPVHLPGIQRSDITYKDVESHARSITPSLSSQSDAPTWHLESRKLTDSPTRAHREINSECFFRPEQIVMSDPLMATGIPVSVVSHSQIDSHGRVPTVDSRNNLMLPQVQRLETGVRPVNVSQVCDIQLPEVSQVSRQHVVEPRREDIQKAEQVPFCPLENVQSIAIPSRQQIFSQCHTPIVTASNQAVGFARPEILPGWLPPKNPVVQTAIYPPGPGTLDSVSVRSLPSLGIQETNPVSELNYMPHEVGQAGGHVEHPVAKIAVHPENDLPIRRLKPLNTRVDNRERGFCVEQTTRHQIPMAVMVEKPNDNHDGTYLQDYLTDSLQQPRTPPYAGGSPYRESLSPFIDRKAHKQMQHDDAAIYPHLSPFADSKVFRDDRPVQPQSNDAVSTCHEGVDWAMKKQLNGDMGWSNFNQLEKMEESNRDINLIKLSDSSPLPTCDSSFINPSTIGIGKVSTQAAFKPNIAESLPNLEGVKTMGSAQSPRLNGAHLNNPLSTNSIENSNSLFVAKLEEGQWFKGMEADTQIKNDPGRNFIKETFGIPGNPFSGDSLSGHLSEDKNSLQQGSLRLRADNVNMLTNNEQTFDTHMQPTTSKTTFCPVEVSDLQASWLPPHESGGKLERKNPVYCLAEEESTSSTLLAEGLTYFNDDLMSSVQNNKWCAVIGSSENGEFPNSRNEPSTISNVTEGKTNFSILDSGPVQKAQLGDDADHRPNNTEVMVASSLLYSEPTLSIQNWKESLATARLEDQEPTEIFFDSEKKDEVTFRSLVVKVSEMKVDDDPADTDGDRSNTHLHPAAVAEAEAISRGLQTIKNADLEELRELGTGNFGTVYHGKWRGTDVAIKRIKSSCFTGRPSERERLIADFWNEAYVLGQLHHPNVVAFYGVVPDGPDGTLATVTEYMVNGSLKQVLQKKDRTIDRRKRLLIIMDAAFGMEYLHGKNIIHFDFKCENLLVNMKDPQRPICKVGDLGLSKVKRQTMVSGGVRGTLPWMAPELLNGCSSFVTEKVDVFSFGVVMWELLTGEEPYADMHYGAIIGGIVSNTLRPAIPSWCEPAWKSLMERCWSTDPSARPSFVEIAAELRAMANAKS